MLLLKTSDLWNLLNKYNKEFCHKETRNDENVFRKLAVLYCGVHTPSPSTNSSSRTSSLLPQNQNKRRNYICTKEYQDKGTIRRTNSLKLVSGPHFQHSNPFLATSLSSFLNSMSNTVQRLPGYDYKHKLFRSNSSSSKLFEYPAAFHSPQPFSDELKCSKSTVWSSYKF